MFIYVDDNNIANLPLAFLTQAKNIKHTKL